MSISPIQNPKSAIQSRGDEWGTPRELYDRLDAVFHFTLDAAATNANHLAPAWYTMEQNALGHEWPGRVFCNPPYSDPSRFVDRAGLAVAVDQAELVVMLLPVDTSTEWFKTTWRSAREIVFLYKRLSYLATGGRRGSARFASCIALWTKQPFRTLAPVADLGFLIPLKEARNANSV